MGVGKTKNVGVGSAVGENKGVGGGVGETRARGAALLITRVWGVGVGEMRVREVKTAVWGAWAQNGPHRAVLRPQNLILSSACRETLATGHGEC